jgi:phosphate transport system substrate-binding protein
MFASCGGNGKTMDTPTSGNVKIGCDESYKLLIQSEIDLFESIYQYAVITPEYGPEAQVVDQILRDSVRCIIISRELTENEKASLLSRQIIAKTTKIAFDGLAFVVNTGNPDSTLSYNQIADIFNGKIKNWSELEKSNKNDSLKVIFDHNGSGNPRYIRERFKIKGNFPSNCYAVNSNEEVIKFVENNPNALGVISCNWISDRDDTTSINFRKSIKVVGVSDELDKDNTGPFTKPYQAYIADGSYPFCRDVYIINCETYAGLGTGFAAFIAGEKGQRVVLKSGLVPATMPVRLVQFSK